MAGGRKAGGGGREAPPHISSRGRRTESSSQRLSEAASKSGRARVPYLKASLAPFLPQRPHPRRGPRPGSGEAAERGGADGTAGQQRLLQVPGAPAAVASRRLLRWNQPGSHPRAPLSRNTGSTAASLPPGAGLTIQSGRSLLDLLLFP